MEDLLTFLASYVTIFPGFYRLLAIFLIFDLCLYTSFSAMKWFWMAAVGISYQDRVAIFANRRAGFNLSELIERYPERTLMILDGISRKSAHILGGIAQLVILTVLSNNPKMSTQVLLSRTVIFVTLMLINLGSNRILGPAGILFGAFARIRDGIYGRHNILTAISVGFIRTILIIIGLFLLKQAGIDDKTILIVSWFVFMPIIIGDAMGEVIGCLWGKQTIRVTGVGEINRRSKLGSAAVFTFSLLPLLIYLFVLGQFNPFWISIALLTATVTTFVELISPRGTDNLTIPLVNMVIIYYVLI